MRLLFTFLHRYPLQSAIALGALLFAGLIEGFGLSLMVPLLSIAVSGNETMAAAGASGTGSTLEQIVREAFGVIGLTPSIGMLLICFVVSMIVKSFLMLAANKRVGYMVAQVATDLRLNLIRALFEARWEYFISQPTGALTNSIATEADRSAGAYLNVIRILAAIMHAIIYTTIAVLVSWKATLIALAAGIFIIVLFRRYIQKSKKAGLRGTKLLQSLLAFLTDSLSMIKPLKTMAREHLADAVLHNKIVGLKKTIKKQVYAGSALSAFQEPVTVAFLASGLYLVLVIWKLPIANILVMMYMLQKVMKRLQKVQTLYQQVVTGESAYWSLEAKVKAAKQQRERLTGTRKISLGHSIYLDRVSFGYGEQWILRNAKLEFPAGSFTAIIGHSGVGKTTVVDLITGLLRPQKGEVLIDGIPIAEIDLRHWRQTIGYVPQETLLLHDTVFVNVTLGDKQFSKKDVEYALRASGAWEFIGSLSEGIHTIVGERGHRLSGGQRQRIAIARALAHQPKLLILDEATTSLDPENEAAICETLRELKGKHTIIAISHQPAILKVAERAYRLEDGKIILAPDLLMQNTATTDIPAVTAQ
jgi:ATP-binding cassette subfamily C protein